MSEQVNAWTSNIEQKMSLQYNDKEVSETTVPLIECWSESDDSFDEFLKSPKGQKLMNYYSNTVYDGNGVLMYSEVKELPKGSDIWKEAEKDGDLILERDTNGNYKYQSTPAMKIKKKKTAVKRLKTNKENSYWSLKNKLNKKYFKKNRC
jgi:hypothetical protein